MSSPTTSPKRPAQGPVDHRPFQLHGMLLSAGAVAWALSQVVVGGLDPTDDPGDLAVFGVGSVLFQIGLLALLSVIAKTKALGSGPLARAALRVQAVLVSLAIASSAVDAIGVSDLDKPGWALLDAFWPISMLGMFLIGVRVAVAGRWVGVARWWPLVAESWALVTLPVMGAAGEGAATAVSVVHLLVGYAVLGQLVARRDQ